METTQPLILDLTSTDSHEVVRRFLVDLRSGIDWFEALAEAIAQWRTPEETIDGYRYRYLVGDAAFDWLLLAERLLAAADGLVPQQEEERLLLHGIVPANISGDWFKNKIGPAKWSAVVNHWYGVRVEEALVLAVEHEIRKQRHGLHAEEPYLDDAVYLHVYGLGLRELLVQFLLQRGLPLVDSLTIHEHEEFTYWLFQFRLKHSDKARLASDTKKGLDFLRSLGRLSVYGVLGQPERVPA